MEGVDSPAAKNTCLIFTLENDDSGALAKSLKIFKDNDVNLLHIESRSSTRVPGYEFFIEAESKSGNLGQAIEDLKESCSYFSVISRDYKDNTSTVPWFPRRIRDLDRFANQILSYGAELDCDHPGFTDEVYRKRRYCNIWGLFIGFIDNTNGFVLFFLGNILLTLHLIISMDNHCPVLNIPKRKRQLGV